jgi:uncharacterized phage-like protein YoqJ
VILAGTGHRPNNLGGYGISVMDRLVLLAKEALEILEPAKCISGAALGWDTAIMRASIILDIPFIAAVPFLGQESAWPESSQAAYQDLLSRAESVHVISSGGYSASKMQTRNEWMVDNCDAVLALYDGQSSGGTRNCLEYATRKNRLQFNLWEAWQALGSDNFNGVLQECLRGEE